MVERVTVTQGQCVHSIACEKGFFPDTVWEHPNNSSLKELRKDPHVLRPGDVVFIPDKKPKYDVRPSDRRHVFRRKGVPKFMRIQLNFIGEPISGMLCSIAMPGRDLEMTSDKDGWIEIPIPPDLERVTVTLESGEKFDIMLGYVDPLDSLSGVQGRLHALGYYDGPVDDQMSDELHAAIDTFQTSHGLDVTGEPDETTQAALSELAGL